MKIQNFIQPIFHFHILIFPKTKTPFIKIIKFFIIKDGFSIIHFRTFIVLFFQQSSLDSFSKYHVIFLFHILIKFIQRLMGILDSVYDHENTNFVGRNAFFDKKTDIFLNPVQSFFQHGFFLTVHWNANSKFQIIFIHFKFIFFQEAYQIITIVFANLGKLSFTIWKLRRKNGKEIDELVIGIANLFSNNLLETIWETSTFLSVIIIFPSFQNDLERTQKCLCKDSRFIVLDFASLNIFKDSWQFRRYITHIKCILLDDKKVSLRTRYKIHT